MTPDQLRLLSSLLDRGMALSAVERDAWLATLSGDAASLAATLRELLAKHTSRDTGDLIDRPPGFPAANEAGEEPSAGCAVGPYRLLHELGRGGMGSVWLAACGDDRRVALKLPYIGWAPGLAERFAREHRILAALQHQHIARLYEAGIDGRGRPYMALEYVDGRHITVYCDEKKLDWRARVELALQVMAAVQYAHEKLVIHRDLKPSNILVTALGHAMLVDFGIAKLLQNEQGSAHETELTQLGGRALTLGYSAPEQLKGGPVSTATDVYALGVLLYELLACRPPFRGTRSEVEQAILTQDAPKPKGLPANLADIVLKALRKAPSDRYPTVTALAEDLARWLSGLPVQARLAGPVDDARRRATPEELRCTLGRRTNPG